MTYQVTLNMASTVFTQRWPSEDTFAGMLVPGSPLPLAPTLSRFLLGSAPGGWPGGTASSLPPGFLLDRLVSDSARGWAEREPGGLTPPPLQLALAPKASSPPLGLCGKGV